MTTYLDHLFGENKWREVEPHELEKWIAAYPRPLTVVPPLSEKRVAVRNWRDATLGEGDAGTVAIMTKSRHNTVCNVLRVVPFS